MKKRMLYVICTLTILLSGCYQSTSQPPFSDDFGPQQEVAELTDPRLTEVSGMAASKQNAGMFWVHNDSGNEAEVFLIDEKLNVRLTIKLDGIDNRDWEDIAVAPGPVAGTTYIYVGDIGDNDAVFPYKYVYRFEEPKLGAEQVITIGDFQTIIFQLEDKVKDTESFFVDHATQDIFIISKRESPVYLYQLTKPVAGDTTTARKLFALPFSEIVAADFSPKSGDVLLKNYQSIYYWKNDKQESVVSLLKKPPVQVRYHEEPKGESIAWATDSSGFYTLSEKKKKKPVFLYRYPRH